MHTNAPWTFSNNRIWGTENEIALIRTQAALNDSPDAGKRANEESQSNGNLIAAAPELLESLKAIVALSQDQGRMNLPECAGMAKAAIAKAEGK